MVVLLSRRIKSLQAFSDDADIGCGVIFGEGAVIYFCLLCFHFGELAELSGVAGAAGGLGVSSFSGGGGKSFVCPLFCERVGFYGIPDGFRFRAAVGFGGVGLFFRSSAFWSAAVDCSSSLLLHRSAADVLSVIMMRFGASVLWFMRRLQGLAPPAWFGGGPWPALGCLLRRDRREDAWAAMSRASWRFGAALCNFQVVQGVFSKISGMYCASS